MWPSSSTSSSEAQIMENGLMRETWMQNTLRYWTAGLGLRQADLVPPPEQDDFYTLNATANDLKVHAPGTLLRSRGIYLNDFPGFEAEKQTAWQFAYVTRGQHNVPEDSQVTIATVIVPPNVPQRDWRDRVLFLCPKSDSSSPSFRTSYLFRRGSGSLLSGASEQVFLIDFLQRGCIAVIVDHEGQHDAFGAGPTSGHALLDAMRATLNFKELGLAPEKQVKFIAWGYSGGAIGITWANMLLNTYAPELQNVVKAWSCGGVPVDLHAVALRVNNNLAAGLIVGVLHGLSNIDPDFAQWIQENTTDAGKKALTASLDGAFWPIMKHTAFVDILGMSKKSGDKDEHFFTSSGDPLLESIPARVMDENSLKVNLDSLAASSARPSRMAQQQKQQDHLTPVFWYQSFEDEVVPIASVDRVVQTWSTLDTCKFDYRRVHTFLHIATIFAMHSQNVEWIMDRFNDKPLPPPSSDQEDETVLKNVTRSDVHDIDITDDHSKTFLGKKRTKAIGSFYDRHAKEAFWWH